MAYVNMPFNASNILGICIIKLRRALVGGEMEIDAVMVGLSSRDALVRRGSAKALSEVSESDPTQFTENSIERVASVLRETDDPLTLEHLLLTMGNVAYTRLTYLVKAGLLRVATDIFIKNMSAVGLHVSRDAIRLISILAPADSEGAKKIGVVKLIVRALENSTDPCIRWYALLALRKLDLSVIQSGIQDIVSYSTKAMVKENDEDTRLLGASALLAVASVAPQVLGETRTINTMIEALTKDLSIDVQASVALALQFIARAAPSKLRETRIGEALFETMTKTLKVLKTSQEKEETEIFLTTASTAAMLALKDATALSGDKTTSKFDPAETVLRIIEESRGVETSLRSMLFSILENLSEKAPQYLSNRRVVETLERMLEGDKEEDSIKNRIAWIVRTINNSQGSGMAAKTPVRETELKEGKGERKELKLTEEQRNSLLEIFRTAREMPISELAKKLNVDQDVLQGALERLAQAGKLSLKIEGGILYLGKKQR
jgi:hypothetical protein